MSVFLSSSSLPRVATTTPERDVAWTYARRAAWAVGVAIVLALVVAPRLGLHALWNVLIPVAPALFVFVPGFWRNVCPLAATARFAGRTRANVAARPRPMSRSTQEWFAVGGVAAFFLIVPLRHVWFDTGASSSVMLLGFTALAAVVLAIRFDAKSGWCSGLCPVHPVEKLYGSDPVRSVRNASCSSCSNCVELCPDSVSGSYALAGRRRAPRRIAGIVLAGALPGFIAAWFRVPDMHGLASAGQLAIAYGVPFAGGVASLVAFVALLRALGRHHERMLTRFFALAAVTVYYTHRLPALFGGGAIPGDGTLVDLTAIVPAGFFTALTLLPVAVFGAWFIAVDGRRRAWSPRPASVNDTPRKSEHDAPKPVWV